MATTDHLISSFLDSTKPLEPGDAVAALLVLEDGSYIMQLRDLKDNIFYPGHWGLFGGAVDAGETESEALKRELDEELGFKPATIKPFARLHFDLGPIGAKKVYRSIFEVPVTYGQFSGFVLQEGMALEAIDARELLVGRPVTPYDSFAVWLHFARHRIVPHSRPAATRGVQGAVP